MVVADAGVSLHLSCCHYSSIHLQIPAGNILQPSTLNPLQGIPPFKTRLKEIRFRLTFRLGPTNFKEPHYDLFRILQYKVWLQVRPQEMGIVVHTPAHPPLIVVRQGRYSSGSVATETSPRIPHLRSFLEGPQLTLGGFLGDLVPGWALTIRRLGVYYSMESPNKWCW